MNGLNPEEQPKTTEEGNDDNGVRPFFRIAGRHSPIYLLAVIVGSIVAADLFVLTAIHAFHKISITAEILIATFLTALVLTPLLYYLAIRPLAHEIRKRRRMEGELKRLAMTDSLTKINNREKFYEVIERETERFKRHGQPLSILMFDIDGFKSINDTYGHNVGDDVLKTLTALINAHLREIDYFAGSIAKCNTWESRKEGAILSGYVKKRICSPVFV